MFLRIKNINQLLIGLSWWKINCQVKLFWEIGIFFIYNLLIISKIQWLLEFGTMLCSSLCWLFQLELECNILEDSNVITIWLDCFYFSYVRFSGGRQKTTEEYLLADRYYHDLKCLFNNVSNLFNLISDQCQYGQYLSVWWQGNKEFKYQQQQYNTF